MNWTNRLTVRFSSTSRDVNTMEILRARATICVERMLSPPSATKSSSIPTRSTPSTSANTPLKSRSASEVGARYLFCTIDGAGSPARSSFPDAVNGHSPSTTITDGAI